MMENYWKKFDLLCSELEMEGKQNLVGELRKAQSYVNGFTDGWYDFLNSFEKAITTQKLNDQTQHLANALIVTLKSRLNNR